jgi:hypothetical protein
MISNPFKRGQSNPRLSGRLARLREQRPWPEDLTTTGKQWLEQSGDIVGRYPAVAIAVAFSLGIGVGWWIKRRG